VTPSALHLIASLLLTATTLLLLVVLSRPARERRRDLRAWEEELSRRPVDLSAVVLRRRGVA
jgi:hypothetical protein